LKELSENFSTRVSSPCTYVFNSSFAFCAASATSLRSVATFIAAVEMSFALVVIFPSNSVFNASLSNAALSAAPDISPANLVFNSSLAVDAALMALVRSSVSDCMPVSIVVAKLLFCLLASSPVAVIFFSKSVTEPFNVEMSL